MLSRVASNLYWFGRYIQRAENIARLINVRANLLFDLPREVETGWGPILEILGAEENFRARYADSNELNSVRFLILDTENPGSIASSLQSAREIMRTVRDSLPSEAWEKLNDLHLYIQEKGEKSLSRNKRGELLARVTDGVLLLHGTLSNNMSHDEGFQLLRIGTNLEQADMTTRIIDVRSSSLIRTRASEDLAPFQNIQWMSVLRSLTGYQMYRRHVRVRVTGPNVLRFLLQDREFPRSVTFCLNMIASTLPHLPEHRRIARTLDRTRGLTHDANLDQLVESGLHELMDEIQIGLAQVHEALDEAFFKL